MVLACLAWLFCCSCFRYGEVAQACLGGEGATLGELVVWVSDLVTFCGVPPLARFGLAEHQVADLARKSAATSSMKGNPVALTQEELEATLRAAM